MAIYAVIRRRGAPWDRSKALTEQADWPAHGAFMTALHAERFVLLAGPMEAEGEALIVVEAESPEEVERRLAADPWTTSGLLETARVSRWELRLGSLG